MTPGLGLVLVLATTGCNLLMIAYHFAQARRFARLYEIWLHISLMAWEMRAHGRALRRIVDAHIAETDHAR